MRDRKTEWGDELPVCVNKFLQSKKDKQMAIGKGMGKNEEKRKADLM